MSGGRIQSDIEAYIKKHTAYWSEDDRLAHALERALWIEKEVLTPEKVTSVFLDEREHRLWTFLYMLVEVGGRALANDDDQEWVSIFCDDEPTDTFNRAIDLGLAEGSHNDLTDTSTAWITNSGREWTKLKLKSLPSGAAWTGGTQNFN